VKLPLSWLSKFVTTDATVEELCRRMTVAGLEVENVERMRPAFSGVIVAKVREVARHPNADRLSLCQVDAGAAGHFSVVCGAPNVSAGMTAALATVGARLGKEPPLEAAVIRGIQSEGMLCSERELGFSDEHGGILALPADAPAGEEVARFLHLDDAVLDIAIPANRGDCASILGLAREAAALFAVKLHVPRIAVPKPGAAGDSAPFAVAIDAPELCPRYAALAMTGIKIGPSPIRLRRRLELCGMRALNNIVDITNYVMLERGQPLHAFELEKIGGRKIVVRRAGADREFTTLDNLARSLDPADLVIADAERPLAIAGIMGGLNSEVGDATTEIVLESAYFEPAAIARTSRRLALRSEASYRFERVVDPTGQVLALHRAAELIGALAGGRTAGATVDCQSRPAEQRAIILDLGAMKSLLGASIAPATVKRRLRALGCDVAGANRGQFTVTPPAFRSDLSDPADLAEEVARLGGLEEIPAVLPARIAAGAPADPAREFLRGTREVMLGCGLTEVLTIAFAAPSENARFRAGAPDSAPLAIENPLSAEMSELRASLIPGLLAALRFNLNREASAFHVFEFGKTFAMSDGVPRERLRIAGMSYGPYVAAPIGEKPVEAGFFTLKGVLERYFETLGRAGEAEYQPIDSADAPYLHPGRSARVLLAGRKLGYVGELHPEDALRLDLKSPCAVYELDLEELISYGFTPRKSIEPPPRFPAIRRDVALVVDRETRADLVIRTMRGESSPLLENVEVFDVYEGTAVAPGKKSVALACRYRARDRTLTDEEVNRVHTALVERTAARLGAVLRQ
jgi:phenylalanyl-tRNA synthetase beta chain